MNHKEAGAYWEDNAEAWTRLARAGHDIYRDFVNTPAFFELLPDVAGRTGLDLGCGEGHNTRLLAKRGARVTGVDVSPTFIRHALKTEAGEKLGITYLVASAVELPLPDASFDFVTATMSLMEIPETEAALREIHRVLKSGGFLQFSIPHPCFDTPYRRNLTNERGQTYAIEVGDYFENRKGDIAEWTFKSAPAEAVARLRKFRVPKFTRTLSQWVNLLVSAGFTIEQMAEPRPDDAAVAACPVVQDAQVVAYFLQVRVRKTT